MIFVHQHHTSIHIVSMISFLFNEEVQLMLEYD